MASIGGHSVTTLTMTRQPVGTQLRNITRPGVSGTGYKKTGTRGTQFRAEIAVDIADGADGAGVTTEENALLALQGSSLSVVDSWGRTTSGLVCESMTITSSQAVSTSSGGITADSDALVRAVAVLVDAGTSN